MSPATAESTTTMPAAGDHSIAAQWAHYRDQRADLDARQANDGGKFGPLYRLETDILSAPIVTTADAVAKLAAVKRVLDVGGRSDGADRAAIVQTMCWLMGRS